MCTVGAGKSSGEPYAKKHSGTNATKRQGKQGKTAWVK